MIKDFLVKHKSRIIHEGGTWLTMIMSFVVADGRDVLLEFYSGNYDQSSLGMLKLLIVNSIIKAALIKLIPELFPLYKKSAISENNSSIKQEDN